MSEKAPIGSEIEVTDSILDWNYWVARPWVSPASAVDWQGADVLVVPWEAFREGRAALFPEGTSDLVRHLRRELAIEVAIDRDKYEEIALYANAWRLPTLLCKYAVIPLVINLLSSEIDRRFVSNKEESLVTVELIVEGPSRRCVSIKYKGPAIQLPSELLNHLSTCFPELHRHFHAQSEKKAHTHKSQISR